MYIHTYHLCKYTFFFFFQKTSIVKASWPKIGEISEIDVKASSYLMEAAHSFRVFLKNYLAIKKPNKAKGEAAAAPEKPDKATIWIAKTFPPWQAAVLTLMKKMHDVSI